MTITNAVDEYRRIISSIDMRDESRNDIIDCCLTKTPAYSFSNFPKPAIAAIYGAAVIAAAFGIRKIYNIKNRP